MNSSVPDHPLASCIDISVHSQYLEADSNPEKWLWRFSYTVDIKNNGDAPVQLLARHWRIDNHRGNIAEVRGEGVVGEQPTIEPGHNFCYTSGAELDNSNGSMEGEYLMRSDDGETFEISIPMFALIAPSGMH